MFRLTEWIRDHRSASLAILAGLVLLGFTAFNPQWWGDRAVGVLIGAVSLVVAFPILMILLEKIQLDEEPVYPWLIFIIPTATALIVRRTSGHRLVWPIQFHIPAVPSPQSLFLIVTAILLLMLIIVFVRALHRGEGVAIESHWGGLGGGMGGWQLSTPLIYLLGIVLLLAVSSAIAWRVFTPTTESQQPQRQPASSQTNSDNSSSTQSPAASLSPSPAASPSP